VFELDTKPNEISFDNNELMKKRLRGYIEESL